MVSGSIDLHYPKSSGLAPNALPSDVKLEFQLTDRQVQWGKLNKPRVKTFAKIEDLDRVRSFRQPICVSTIRAAEGGFGALFVAPTVQNDLGDPPFIAVFCKWV
jgi:hypothetical protein